MRQENFVCGECGRYLNIHTYFSGRWPSFLLFLYLDNAIRPVFVMNGIVVFICWNTVGTMT